MRAADPLLRRLVFCVALGFAIVEIDLSPSPEATFPAPPRATPAPHRVLAVLVDSLRFDVAMNADVMPTLARLREGALWGETTPCRDEVTTECLRAALGGVDRSSALTAVASRIAAVDRSLLPFELHARGVETWVCSDQGERLLQGAVDPCHAPGKRDGEPWNDARRADAAIEAYSTGRQGLVLAHLVDADNISHVARLGSARYREAFRRADRLIARLSSALRPGDSLWIFGDHGHDERGRHLFGVASRTFHLYRGPAFRAGRRDLAMVDHRLLLGALMGEPPGASYEGTRSLDMFAAPFVRARPWLESAVRDLAPAPASPSWRPRLAPLAALLALLAVLLALEARDVPRLRVVLFAAGGLAAFVAIGAVYPEMREILYGRSWMVFHAGFIALAVLACFVAHPANLAGAATVAMVAAFTALPPTVATYGALRGTAMFVGAAWLGLRRGNPLGLQDAAVAALLVAFHGVTGENFRILRMDAFYGAERHGLTALVAIAAQITLYLPLPASRRSRWVGGALGLIALAVPERLPGPLSLMMFVGGAAVAVAAAAGARIGIATALVAAQIALGVAFQGETQRQAAVFALWALGGLIARAAARSTDVRAPHLAGLCVAWLAAYSFWPTMAGRFGDADWRFALAWLDVDTADRHWWLTTLLLWGKYMLPLFGLVALLRTQLADRAVFALEAAVRLVGLRALALVAMIVGIATRAWLSGMYREAAETAILMTVLALTLSVVALAPLARAAIPQSWAPSDGP